MEKSEIQKGAKLLITGLKYTEEKWGILSEMSYMVGKRYINAGIIKDYATDGKMHDGVLIDSYIFDYRDLQKGDNTIKKPVKEQMFDPENLYKE